MAPRARSRNHPAQAPVRAPIDASIEDGPSDAWHFGRFGEAAAGRWYRRAGYRILARNWRCPQGELDLIAGRGRDVVFVEVKARTDDRYGTGAEAVDRRKQRRLRAAAGRWLDQADQPFDEVRFDVVEVDRRGRLEIHRGCL